MMKIPQKLVVRFCAISISPKCKEISGTLPPTNLKWARKTFHVQGFQLFGYFIGNHATNHFKNFGFLEGTIIVKLSSTFFLKTIMLFGSPNEYVKTLILSGLESPKNCKIWNWCSPKGNCSIYPFLFLCKKFQFMSDLVTQLCVLSFLISVVSCVSNMYFA